jgi:hypothetical protein
MTIHAKLWGAICKNLWDLLDLRIDFPLQIPWNGFITRGPGTASWCSLVHHGPVAGMSRELFGAAPGSRFRWRIFALSGGKEGEGLRDPHRRRMGRRDDSDVPASKSGGGGAWSLVGGQYGCGCSELMQGLGTWCGDDALGSLL